MSNEAMAWAWKMPLQSAPQKAVLVAVADAAGHDWTCWPSVSTIAEMTCLGRSTVCRVLKELEARGLLIRTARTRGSGSQNSSLTILTPHSPGAEDLMRSYEEDRARREEEAAAKREAAIATHILKTDGAAKTTTKPVDNWGLGAGPQLSTRPGAGRWLSQSGTLAVPERDPLNPVEPNRTTPPTPHPLPTNHPACGKPGGGENRESKILDGLGLPVKAHGPLLPLIADALTDGWTPEALHTQLTDGMPATVRSLPALIRTRLEGLPLPPTAARTSQALEAHREQAWARLVAACGTESAATTAARLEAAAMGHTPAPDAPLPVAAITSALANIGAYQTLIADH